MIYYIIICQVDISYCSFVIPFVFFVYLCRLTSL
uniref:Uncharacterized protein n=1 Tax=Arundo donax TaxID=35708 RepID=A0A0A9HRT2_ARUDO